ERRWLSTAQAARRLGPPSRRALLGCPSSVREQQPTRAEPSRTAERPSLVVLGSFRFGSARVSRAAGLRIKGRMPGESTATRRTLQRAARSCRGHATLENWLRLWEGLRPLSESCWGLPRGSLAVTRSVTTSDGTQPK